MKRVLFAIAAAALLAGCSPAQDANIKTAVSNFNGQVQAAANMIVGKVKTTCPVAAANAGSVEMLTQLVFTVLGLPATGLIAVNIEAAGAQMCLRLAAAAPVSVVPASATPATTP